MHERLPEANRLPGWIGDESSGCPNDELTPEHISETLEVARRETPELAPSPFARPQRMIDSS